MTLREMYVYILQLEERLKTVESELAEIKNPVKGSEVQDGKRTWKRRNLGEDSAGRS